MEIKTLEHYIVSLLEDKDNEIKELEIENGKLVLQMREYREKYEELKNFVMDNLKFKETEQNAWYSLEIWRDFNTEKEFQFMGKLWKDKCARDESEQGEEIRGDN